jgi:hypothetical protein
VSCAINGAPSWMVRAQRRPAGLGWDSKPKKFQGPRARPTCSTRGEIGYRDGAGVRLLAGAGSCTRTTVA